MPEPITPEEDMLRACMCLRLEVPKIIADDVEAKAKHLIADRDSWKKLAEIVSESRDKAFARVEKLEKALKEYADPDNWNDKQDWDTDQVYEEVSWVHNTRGTDIARAALGKEE